jgi:Sensors of blue-light using FAD
MGEKDLRSLVFASSAVRLFSHEELVGLLRLSRTNNARLGITGMLLYDSGNFIQAIEGPRDNVDKLFERIRVDPRHKQVTVIMDVPLGERQFKSYTMGFINGADLSEEDRAAYTNFLREPVDTSRFEATAHPALRLLLSFRRHTR